jgi:hypothetical protein
VANNDQELRPEDLTDELARKYDPERLLQLIAHRVGRGESLDHSVRARYERRFGVDLSHVRVYSGELAQALNRKRNTYALTIGASGMILMSGSPDKSMASAEGRALLAHELTHVAQQARQAGGGPHRTSSVSGAMAFAAEHEAEAEAEEQAVLDEQRGTSAAAGRVWTVVQATHVKPNADNERKETIEKIKQRVIELFGETARLQLHRGGSSPTQ